MAGEAEHAGGAFEFGLDDAGAGEGVALVEEAVAEVGVAEQREGDEFEEGGGVDAVVGDVFEEVCGGLELGEVAGAELGFEPVADGLELGLVGLGAFDGFKEGEAVWKGVVVREFELDACAADALHEELEAASREGFVLHDLADADGAADGRAACVGGFPVGAGECGHGDLAGGVEDVADHADVPVLEDVEGDDLLWDERGLGEREERHGPAEVDADGVGLVHA